ncbi:metallophosphoesterase [Neorhizobium galegae]|uniref:metallophosphoesterase n=1 Tax=Neorhizobium galegae TaxID=399 RepID=UPI0021025CC4|nr:metallophosphoesterase [Neorhizobium galegae]MCQ1839156.1 metallophosphoesterase [Neorhizobium galegae]
MSLLYAVGDVHGRADLLENLLGAVERDAEAAEAEPVIIFLGDIIDRGPDSRRAMDLVQSAISDHPGSSLILGNHDALFRSFINGTYTDNLITYWLTQLGGLATIDSYLPDRPRKLDDIQDALVEQFGHHQELLNGSVDKIVTDHFCFVHAGIRPGVPLDEQDPYDLRWIRDDFLSHDLPLERFVVHGHTPTESSFPDVLGNRVCLDTGAYYSGRLTAARFQVDRLDAFIYSQDSGISVDRKVLTWPKTSVGPVRPLAKAESFTTDDRGAARQPDAKA